MEFVTTRIQNNKTVQKLVSLIKTKGGPRTAQRKPNKPGCVKLPCKTQRDISCQHPPWRTKKLVWDQTHILQKTHVLKLCWQHLHVQAALISEGQHTWVAPCDHFLPPTNASPRMLSASTVSGVNNRLHCHPTHPKNSNPVRYAWCIHIQWILWILEQDGTFLQSKQVSSYMLHMVDNLWIINI